MVLSVMSFGLVWFVFLCFCVFGVLSFLVVVVGYYLCTQWTVDSLGSE